MPITPRFEISQTESDLVIVISVPHIRVSANSLEVVIEDDHILHFYAAPYLLRLAFGEGRVRGLDVNDNDNVDCQFAANADEECSTYDPGSGGQEATLTLRLTKAIPGHEWPQLDMTARLLQPKAIPTRYDWLKQVVDSEDYTNAEANKNDGVSELEAGAQPLEKSTVLLENNNHHTVDGYGFANMFHNIFNDFCRDGLAKEMLHLPHPEDTTNEERRQQRLEQEFKDFDVDRYLGDLNLSEGGEEDYLYAMAMAFEPHWKNPSPSFSSSSSSPPSSSDDASLPQQLNQLSIKNNIIETSEIHTGQNSATDCTTATSPSSDSQSKPKATNFTSNEQLLLATIPYPLLPETILADCKTGHENAESKSTSLWNGLLDILFAYVYDHLLTQGDATVESAWTISTLSCSLGWLDNSCGFTSSSDPQSGGVGDVVTASLRRTLIYPYFRNLEFGIHVWNQVCEILQFPSEETTKCIIRCLLQVRTILEQSESYYLGNKLYIDPYLAWLQRQTSSIPSESLVGFIRQKISDQSTSSLKETIGLRLIESEQLLLREDDEGNDTSDGDNSGSSSGDDDDDDDDDEEEEEADSDDETSEPCTAETMKQENFSNSDLAQQEQRTTLNPDLQRSIVSNALMDSELRTQSSVLEIVPLKSDTIECVEDIEDDTSSKKKPLIQELK